MRLPLDSLWSEDRELSAKRIKYLDHSDISNLLKGGLVQFVFADVGSKLDWRDVKECYTIFKTEVLPYILPGNQVEIGNLVEGYGFWASLWDSEIDIPVVLLEKVH